MFLFSKFQVNHSNSTFSANQDDPEWKTKELRRLLWRAPELLRDPSPPPRGTQKGDVYSFAIVLYEIIGRQGPWGKITMESHGEKSHFIMYIFQNDFFF